MEGEEDRDNVAWPWASRGSGEEEGKEDKEEEEKEEEETRLDGLDANTSLITDGGTYPCCPPLVQISIREERQTKRLNESAPTQRTRQPLSGSEIRYDSRQRIEDDTSTDLGS